MLFGLKLDWGKVQAPSGRNMNYTTVHYVFLYCIWGWWVGMKVFPGTQVDMWGTNGSRVTPRMQPDGKKNRFPVVTGFRTGFWVRASSALLFLAHQRQLQKSHPALGISLLSKAAHSLFTFLSLQINFCHRPLSFVLVSLQKKYISV